MKRERCKVNSINGLKPLSVKWTLKGFCVWKHIEGFMKQILFFMLDEFNKGNELWLQIMIYSLEFIFKISKPFTIKSSAASASSSGVISLLLSSQL